MNTDVKFDKLYVYMWERFVKCSLFGKKKKEYLVGFAKEPSVYWFGGKVFFFLAFELFASQKCCCYFSFVGFILLLPSFIRSSVYFCYVLITHNWWLRLKNCMRSLSFVLYLSLCVKLSFSLFHHFLFRLHIRIPIYSPFCFRKLCVCVSIRVLIFLSLHSERLSKKCQQLLNR